MSGDKKKKIWRPPAWAVLTALAAPAIVAVAARWVLDTRFPDPDLPTAYLKALPGDRQATLQWKPDESMKTDVEWQYERRYAWREKEYNPPSRWKSVPKRESHVVTGLVNDWGYVFRVRAVRGNKRGRPSNEAAVTPTAVPALLKSLVRTTLPQGLTLFRFPNARLSPEGVPAGDGVIIPEHAVLRAMAALDGCAQAGDPVTVTPYGFASDAPFRYADWTPLEDSDVLNLETAYLRASNAYCGLTEGATAHPHVRIEEPYEWSSLGQMVQTREDESLITYPDDVQDREPWRRVVVLKVRDPGRCTFE